MHAALLVERLSSRFEVTTCRATGGTVDITRAFWDLGVMVITLKGLKLVREIDWGCSITNQDKNVGKI